MEPAEPAPTVTPEAVDRQLRADVDRAEVSAGHWLARFVRSPQTSLLIAILIFGAVVAVVSPYFLTVTNIINTIRQGTYVFIIAVPATFV